MSAGYEYSETSYSYNQMLNKMFLVMKLILYNFQNGPTISV